MARKKKSEMSLTERVDCVMKGETWYFAEEFGIEVLARCTALHIYARKEGSEYFESLLRKICIRGDEWAHEKDHPSILAMAAMGQRIKEAEDVKEYVKKRKKEQHGEGN